MRKLRKFMKTVNKVCDACLLATLPFLDFLSACDPIRPCKSRPLLFVTNSSSTFLSCQTLPPQNGRNGYASRSIFLFSDCERYTFFFNLLPRTAKSCIASHAPSSQTKDIPDPYAQTFLFSRPKKSHFPPIMAMSDGRQLHGRGGAGTYPLTLQTHLTHPHKDIGNIAPRSPALRPTDLETPTIKASLYTTGRGGTGNMASNDPTNPSLARQAQDVEAPVGIAREPENTFRYGRGGAANIAQLTEEEIAGAKSRNEQRRKSAAEGVVGQFGKEEKSKKDQKNVVEKGIHKFIRTVSKGP